MLFVCLIINGCCFQMQNKNTNCPSLTSPNFSLKPGDVGPGPAQVIRTQELPHINSSIIQTANQKIMNLHTSQPYKKSNSGGKLPLSLSGLLSPRHSGHHSVTKDNMTNNVQYMSSMSALTPTAQVSESALQAAQTSPRPVSQVSHATVNGLVSPARMYPSNFSPQSVQQGVTSPPLVPAPVSTPPSSKTGLVYLRQDQNIPENFCDKFRPIEPATVATGDSSTGGDSDPDKTDFIDIKNISSDDIVVTLHSVNV